MRKILATTVASVVALVGFAGAAQASATIDLLWADTGTDSISGVKASSAVTLTVVLTAGPDGSQGAGVSVDYLSALGKLDVLAFSSTPGGLLPITLGVTTDTGSRVENVNSGALPPFVGVGLMAGQSHQLGTVTFHKGQTVQGTFEIRSDAESSTDGVLNLTGTDITTLTTFNSAFMLNTPEPGTLSLLVMMSGVILAAGSRRR